MVLSTSVTYYDQDGTSISLEHIQELEEAYVQVKVEMIVIALSLTVNIGNC